MEIDSLKRVVFTQRVEIVQTYNERRDCADQRIAEFIRVCGYLPLPIPNSTSIACEIIDEIKPDGIILVGGNSLVKYGGDAPERDGMENTLVRMAVEKRIPLYGFCRGMQSILDYFGNDLIHVNGHTGVRHVVSGTEGSVEVNSYHNQACVKLKSEEIEVLMRTEDGVIEKIRHKTLPIIGTMWHPEREKPFRKMDIEMVQSLIG